MLTLRLATGLVNGLRGQSALTLQAFIPGSLPQAGPQTLWRPDLQEPFVGCHALA